MNKKIILLSLLGIFQLGFIKTQTVKQTDIPFSEKWFSLSKTDLSKKLKTIKEPLAQAAAAEVLGQYDLCVNAARKVSAQSLVFDRVLMLELRCAKKLSEDEKNGTATELLATLSRIAKYEKILTPTDKSNITAAHLAATAALVRKSQWKILSAEIIKIFNFERNLSKTQRALLYAQAAELMVADRKWSEAFSYLQRAKDLDAELQPENKIDTRIKNVLSLMPQNMRDTIEKAKSKAVAAEVPTPAAPPEEQEIFDQAQSAYLKGEITPASEAMIKLLRKFPVSVKSKWSQDKLMELLTREVDKSRGIEGNSVAKNKIVKQLLDLDPDRMYDWGRVLFDMQSYADAALLFERASEQTEGSTKAAKSLYMAGRSYQLSTNYNNAKDFFKKVTRSYSMAPEFTDASIQWGLINLNEKEISEAITHFEMARSRKMTNQQDLVSLFWLFHLN